jgi:hypothetical protein
MSPLRYRDRLGAIVTSEVERHIINQIDDTRHGRFGGTPLAVATRLADAIGSSVIEYINVSVLEDEPRTITVIVVTPRAVLWHTIASDWAGITLQIWPRRLIRRVEVVDTLIIERGSPDDSRGVGTLREHPSAIIHFADDGHVRIVSGDDDLPAFRALLASLAAH